MHLMRAENWSGNKSLTEMFALGNKVSLMIVAASLARTELACQTLSVTKAPRKEVWFVAVETAGSHLRHKEKTNYSKRT